MLQAEIVGGDTRQHRLAAVHQAGRDNRFRTDPQRPSPGASWKTRDGNQVRGLWRLCARKFDKAHDLTNFAVSAAAPSKKTTNVSAGHGPVLWAWLDLNQRPHPYQGSAQGLFSQDCSGGLRERRAAGDHWRPLGTARIRWDVDQTWTKPSRQATSPVGRNGSGSSHESLITGFGEAAILTTG
jgi:hypothetical protein